MQRKISRKELYKLIWAKPLNTVSKDLKISDSLLRKICEDQNIPMPKAGYWSKVKHNKEVKIPCLPLHSKNKDDTINIEEYLFKQKNGSQYWIFQRGKKIQKEFPKDCIVPSKLSRPHPLVKSAKVYLNAQRPSRWQGFEDVITTRSGDLHFSVTKANLKRLLGFADAFVKLIVKMGYRIEVGSWESYLFIMEEKFELAFREMRNRKTIIERGYSNSELVPNGKLSLKTRFGYNWKEFKDRRIPLEEQLSLIIASFEYEAKKIKKERAENKAWHARQKKIEENRKRLFAIKVWEMKKKEILTQQFKKWQQANELKSYIGIIEKSYSEKVGSTDLKKWVRWAKSIQQSIDPVKNDFNDFLNTYKMSEKQREEIVKQYSRW